MQLYFRNNAPGVTRPNKELKGFAKVWLAPAEQKEITFRVPINILGFYDENMDFSLKKAEIDVIIGTDARTIHHQKSITISKDQKLEKKSFTTEVLIS
ncbi:MAG: fibronectin type III-like domain-contianing protein [Brevinema sp.]